ncbi:MAG: hypothetical protein JOY98_04430 [Candidatus Eremiobacteraeota bacterium]|nr:hypothetical protein [Candidatus Eremiobacteraeota bacterium]
MSRVLAMQWHAAMHLRPGPADEEVTLRTQHREASFGTGAGSLADEPQSVTVKWERALSARDTTALRVFLEAVAQVPAKLLRIVTANGTVLLGEDVLDLPEGTTALLVALGSARKPLTREELCDMLWPESDGDAASTALKMSVHRARVRLGDPSYLRTARGSYFLGPNVTVDLGDIDELTSLLARGQQLTEEQIERVVGHYQFLRLGRPAWLVRREWFMPHERRLQAATREMGLFLARRALEKQEYGHAADIGRTLRDLDPHDEATLDISIRAYLGLGDRRSALEEFHAYEESVAKLGRKPSTAIVDLVQLEKA